MSKADEEAAAKKLGLLLGLRIDTGKLRLGDWGEADGYAQVGPSAFIVLEVEGRQKHPCTNVLKLWPWLEEHPQARVLLLQAYLPSSPGLTSNRGHLAEWAGKKGFLELRVDGELLPTANWPRLDRFKEHNIELPVGVCEVTPKRETQLGELLDVALEFGKGLVLVGAASRPRPALSW